MTRRTILFGDAAAPNGGQGYFPADIKKAYNIPSNLDGSGQTIGILEFSNGYNLRDATQFWQSHGITPPKVSFVSVDGTRNDNGSSPDDEEATLDLQWAGAIAPGAHIVVYEANGGSTYAEFAAAITRTLQYILDDTQYQPSVLSISYGDGESSFEQSDMDAWARLIQQLDAKGVTVCISSGDQGAYGLHDTTGPKTRHADAPASLPFAIAVGGTSLNPNGTETAWTYLGPQNGGATGGGFSAIFDKPAYQNGISGSMRGLPDIACNADPATGYQIIFQRQPAVVGGTSVSCPVFAAVIALANQQREQNGLPPLSGVACALYASEAQSAFRDITTGNNSFNGVQGYDAAPGWDACTGFGSFDATALINYLSQPNVGRTPTSPAPSTSSNPSGSNPEPATPEPAPLRGDGGANPTLPSPPRSDKGVLVRVEAVIDKVEADEHTSDGSHQQLLVRDVQVLKVWNGTQEDIDSQAYVAIRYGDADGLPSQVPGLAPGQSITLQGRYIPAADAYPSAANPGYAVIDETHHPFGFVIYNGQMYQ
ncbi:S53 family peptidase [Alicyclobacillus acidiphilus]|uniref:S53 family peptidase n=1 Tax=Alicyclobacillus acidiphilus TaxID=182455 RepID=UPI000837A205|nr:S53 family peptidase [Alicyclobacillus acidiphilus]